MTTIEDIDDSLNILEPIQIDNSIESFQYFDYAPQSQNNLDQLGKVIQIDINANDTYIKPSESYLVITGQLVRSDNNNAYPADAEITLVNNAMMYLFSQIKLTVGGLDMGIISNPGQVTSMLAYLTQPDDYNSNAGLKSCWCKDTTNHASSIKFRESAALAAGAIAAGALTPVENPNYNQGFAARRGLLMSANPRGSFSFIIPFDHMFGFAGYDKIIYNVKHSLTLTRSAIDHQPIHKAQGVQDGKIKLTNITWRVPLVAPETVRLVELREIISRKESIPVGFMARNHESSSVPQTRDFSWRLNLTSGIEKPRWIIVGFQTLRNQTQEQNPAVFDHLNVTNAYAMLNSQRYPTYDTINSFQINDYSDFYEKFDNYKKKKFGFNSLIGGTQVSFPAFKTLFPLFVFDVTRQSDKLISGVIDLQLKFIFNDNVPADTYAYCVIESDRRYKLTSDGKNLVMKSW